MSCEVCEECDLGAWRLGDLAREKQKGYSTRKESAREVLYGEDRSAEGPCVNCNTEYMSCAAVLDLAPLATEFEIDASPRDRDTTEGRPRIASAHHVGQ